MKEWYNLITGSDFEYDFSFPNWEDEVKGLFDIASSKYPLRFLGHTRAGRDVEIREEERAHTYIIGSTQEGKSKFIEHLVTGDIKRGLGCCVLDPTVGGKTVYSILKYCIRYGVENVLLIDPKYAYQRPFKVPQLSPFEYGNSQKTMRSIRRLEETIRSIHADDEQVTTRINTYLPALLTVLYNAKRGLREFVYFMDKKWGDKRLEILSHTPAGHPARAVLEAIYGEDVKARSAMDEAKTTLHRLRPFTKDTLGLMFHSPTGIDFKALVQQRWVILVNLSPTDGFGVQESKLLGSLIINEIVDATDLYSRPFIERDLKPPPYYLYIDEAANFIGEDIAWTMEHAQKTGLKVTIGHQSSAQFSDTGVLNRIMTVAKMRVQFSLPGRADRSRMDKEIGTTDEAPLLIQEAKIELPKKAFERVRTPDVPDIKEVKPEDIEQFIYDLYSNELAFLDAKALQKKLDEEYAAANPRITKPGKSDGQAANETPVSERIPVSERRRRYKAGQASTGTDTPSSKET